MAVIFESEDGFVLDQTADVAALRCEVIENVSFFKDAIQNLNGTCATRIQEEMSIWRLNPGFFDIKVPFMMDSEFEAWKKHQIQMVLPAVEECGGNPSGSGNARKMRRKRKQLEENELSELEVCFRKLISSTKHIWEPTPDPRTIDNNLSARTLAKKFDEVPHYHPNIMNLVTENNTDIGYIQELDGQHYVIPPRSRYIISRYPRLCELNNIEDKYDLMVIDPPWENKSVKRQKKYQCIHETDLEKLRSIISPNMLIALWMVNNKRIQTYVETCLFPIWNVKKVAEWTWIKVTKSGIPICSFSSSHKKPYEKLLLARGESVTGMEIPREKILVSVPSAVHSHKPYLGEVLRSYLPNNPKCLEIFARCLTPGWTSYGLEVLKFQNILFSDMQLRGT